MGVGVAAAVGVGTALFSASEQRRSAKSAAKKQTRAQQSAFSEQRAAEERAEARRLSGIEKVRELQAGPLRIGGISLEQLESQISAPIGTTEAFKFREREAEKSLSRSLAARGLFNSGKAIRRSVGISERLTLDEIARRDRFLSAGLDVGQQGRLAISAAEGGFALAGSQSALRLGQAASGRDLSIGQIGANRALQTGQINAALINRLGQVGTQAIGGFSGGGAGFGGAGGGTQTSGGFGSQGGIFG